MSESQSRQGTIIKVVHVCIDPNRPEMHVELEPHPRGGYGMLRGRNGEEVFFVDEVVVDKSFATLRVGQSVVYDVDEGPLATACKVRPRRES